MLMLLMACEPASIESPEPTPTRDTVPAVAQDTSIDDVIGDAGLLPVLSITLDTKPIVEDYKTSATLEVIRPQQPDLSDLDDAPRQLTTALGIQIHGSSSTGYPKKGFRIELRDSFGADLKQPLLDLPPGSDFVLHAPYSDKTLVRNALAYSLARSASSAWHPRARLVELVIDGEYEGAYLLVERVRRDQHRVDLPAAAETSEQGDITGG